MIDINSSAATGIADSERGASRAGGYTTLVWLILLSGATAVAVTVALFDRTTLTGISKQWLGWAAACFAAVWTWWARPRLRNGRLMLAVYEPVSLLALTSPLLVACAFFVALVYGSEDFHNQIHHLLYYKQLLSDSTSPVTLFTVLFLAGLAGTLLRGFLALVGAGKANGEAVVSALVGWKSVIPAGIAGYSFLLSTTALMMINVNFWRYWATADGWTTIGHYPFTMTDILHVIEGGVAPYFISFPLLPSTLVASYQVFGHNTLASYLPIIVSNTLLPVGVFLALREITGNHLLALLFALVAGSFPLLRNYTMDVGEADSLLMAAVVFAAYFRARANRAGAGPAAEVVAGLAAAVAAVARAEGILYVAPMYLASLVGRWQDRRFWLSVVALGALLAIFVGVCLREFGIAWPGNHSATLNAGNFVSTLRVASQSRVFSIWAQALGVSDQVFTVIVVAVLAAIALSGFWMLRKDFQLAYMPVVALGNVVMVFFVGPIPAEAAKFHDFFRHMSYGFPLLVVTLGYGLGEVLGTLRGRWGTILSFAAYAALGAVVLAELSLLKGPVTPGAPARSPLMTSDVHVSAAQLLVDPYTLPAMKFRKDGDRYIPYMPEYMATYPDDVYQHYAAADVRRSGNAADYYDAARAIFLALLTIGALSSVLDYASRAARLRPLDQRKSRGLILMG